MKKILLLLTPLWIGFLSPLYAQVKTNFNNTTPIPSSGWFAQDYPVTQVVTIPETAIKSAARPAKSNEQAENKLLYIADAVALSLNIAKLAAWTTDDQFAYGKCTIRAAGARSLSINFDVFFLPEGSTMYVYNENGTMFTGPVTEKENSSSNTWGSWVYKGELLTVEWRVPLKSRDQLQLHVNNLAYGYKDIYPEKVGAIGQSGGCNINVVCAEGQGWERERNAVALVLADNGRFVCSGALVMNTCNTNIPYFLTANHCYIESGYQAQNVEKWRFTFQAWSPSCDPTFNSEGITFHGSTLRANRAGSDFCLVELRQIPSAHSNIHYAGWNNSGVAAFNTTGIHHPAGDVMKISKDYNTPVRANYTEASFQHWQVIWKRGITEGGSSGSPLFDQNQRIIGQLHGGPSTCGGNDMRDFYGCFDRSWTGDGTNSTRLSNWLDPNGTGATSTNSTPVNELSVPDLNLSIGGKNDLCTASETYTLYGAPPGSFITWTSSHPIVSISANGPVATITRTGSGVTTITATVQNKCLRNTSVATPLTVGTYDINGQIPWLNSCLGGADWELGLRAVSPSNQQSDLQFVWTYNGIDQPATPSNIFYTYETPPSCITIGVRAVNSCGTGLSLTQTYCPNCGFDILRIVPNPVKDRIFLSLKDQADSKQRSPPASVLDIWLYDVRTNLPVKQWQVKQDQSIIELSTLGIKKGSYILTVIKNGFRRSQQIIIE
jgi:lysyl endopeptidase